MTEEQKPNEWFSSETLAMLEAAYRPYTVSKLDGAIARTKLLSALAIAVFPVLAVVFLALAYCAEVHSFWNLVLLELSSGFLFFAAAPYAMRLSLSRRVIVRLAGVVVAFLGLLLAYNSTSLLHGHNGEFAQAAAIEFSAALLLLIALEMSISPWLKRLAERIDEMTGRREELAGRRDPRLGPAG